MARPIESTPPLEGQDAERLLASLKTGASNAEMARRAQSARERIDRMTAPKSPPKK